MSLPWYSLHISDVSSSDVLSSEVLIFSNCLEEEGMSLIIPLHFAHPLYSLPILDAIIKFIATNVIDTYVNMTESYGSTESSRFLPKHLNRAC